MRDKFIFGLIDDGVKECLLCGTDLTLERAVALTQHSEASKSQVKAISSNTHLWLDLQKHQNNPGRTDIPIMAWHESHTLALSRYTNEKATNSQVYFHWHHFCDPVTSWQSTMECVVLLGCTNKATFGVRLLPVTVSAWQVNCGCFCTPMDTQWLLFQSNIWKNPPLACYPPPPPTSPPPAHPPPINWIHDIAWRGLEKSVWKSSSISYIYCSYDIYSYKILAIRLFYTYTVNLASIHWGITELQCLEYLKRIFLKIPNMWLCRVFANRVTFGIIL